jgi:ABC-type Fe3+/spermidine/putrescine transport system ATPase subunit
MADEIVVMAAGRVVQAGSPAALYERPASRFVAHFIGESNLAPGRVEAVLGAGAWRVDAGGLPVVATGAGEWKPGDAVVVLVRPERIRLGAAGPEGPNRFAGRVEECAFRGASRRYRVRLPTGAVWSVDEPALGEPGQPVGAAVQAAWRPEDCLALPDS